MMIWAIFYKLNQFSIPLMPHALNFQLTLTPPPPLSLHQKYFLNQKYLREMNLGCVYHFCLLVCVHTCMCMLEYVLFLCVCVLFLSLCVCVSVLVCADAPVCAGVYC